MKPLGKDKGNAVMENGLWEKSNQRHLSLVWLIASLFVLAPAALAKGKLPDLTPVVVDAKQGEIEVRNIGNAAADPSQIYISCSTLRSGKSESCAAGLHLPGYIEKLNLLSFDVPALPPGAKYILHLLGSGAFPRNLTYYHMVITADPLKRIAEADESNNLLRLDAASVKKPVAVTHPPKSEPAGNINLSITMNSKPVKAEIKVVKSGESRIAFWTYLQPGGPALSSPIRMTLAAGTYDIHIKPYGDHLFLEKTMVLQVKSGATLDKSVNLQSGHLEVDAQADGKAVKALISILQDGTPLIGKPGTFVYSPFNGELAAGSYTLVVTNPQDRWKESITIRIDAQRGVKKTVVFNKRHAGFIKIHLLMDGQELPSATFTSFVNVKVFDAANHNQIAPISGGHGKPALLPSGIYDIYVTQHVIGGSETVFKAIRIADDQTVDKSINIPGSGELKLAGRWTHQPLNLADCMHYHNPFNAAHLGALMGGHSVSRGKCLNPVVQKMTVWVSSQGRNDGNVGKIESYVVPRKLVAGIYDITVWPVEHRELAQTIKGVEIVSGGVMQKKLEFRWPDQKK